MDESADVYALGAILYHVLGGRAPYAGADSQDILRRLIEEQPTSLDEVERRYLLHILEVTKHHRSQTAEILGINRRTLYRMAERFGIDLKED